MKNKIITIFRKELLDTLRDRRSLMMMVVIPLLTFPIIINVMVSVMKSSTEKAMTKELTVGYADNGNGAEILEFVKQSPNMTFKAFEDTVSFREKIKHEKLDLAFAFSPNFDQQMASLASGQVHLFYKATEPEAKERLSMMFQMQDTVLLKKRLEKLELNESAIEPLAIEEINVSTDRESIGKYAGGILPYFFIAFSFLGCLYPAIDLFSGEKERGTIETILTIPVQRWKILVGKMLVVILSGILAATLTLLGLYVGLKFIDMPSEMMGKIEAILTPQLILTVYLMMIPLIVFFSGIMITVSIYAKSFKEAQSIITPLNIILVVPAVAGFIPGIELNYGTAFIPIVNIVLSTKDIIAGTIETGPLIISFGSLILFAVIAILFSFRQFGNESNILRT